MLLFTVDSEVEGLPRGLSGASGVIDIDQMSIYSDVPTSSLLSVIAHSLAQDMRIACLEPLQMRRSADILQVSKLVKDKSHICDRVGILVEGDPNLQVKLVVVSTSDRDRPRVTIRGGEDESTSFAALVIAVTPRSLIARSSSAILITPSRSVPGVARKPGRGIARRLFAEILRSNVSEIGPGTEVSCSRTASASSRAAVARAAVFGDEILSRRRRSHRQGDLIAVTAALPLPQVRSMSSFANAFCVRGGSTRSGVSVVCSTARAGQEDCAAVGCLKFEVIDEIDTSFAMS